MARPIVVSQGAAGATDWKQIDPNKIYFGMGFGVTLSASASLTYSVQHSFDNVGANLICTISRSTTTATITFPVPHGLTTADSIIVTGTNSTTFDGNFNVASVPSTTTITYTVTNAGPLSVINALVSPMRVFNNSTVAAQTTAKDGNYAFPIFAVRLNVTSYSSGVATLTGILAGEY